MPSRRSDAWYAWSARFRTYAPKHDGECGAIGASAFNNRATQQIAVLNNSARLVRKDGPQIRRNLHCVLCTAIISLAQIVQGDLSRYAFGATVVRCHQEAEYALSKLV